MVESRPKAKPKEYNAYSNVPKPSTAQMDYLYYIWKEQIDSDVSPHNPWKDKGDTEPKMNFEIGCFTYYNDIDDCMLLVSMKVVDWSVVIMVKDKQGVPNMEMKNC